MQVNTISYYEENAKSLISRYESADINEVQELLLQTFYKNSKLFHKTLPIDLEFNQKFDGIYSIATLMHLSKNDLEETISKIYNLLNQNGKFLMSVSLFRDDIDKNSFDDKGRFFLVLSFDEWINLLEKIGFKILDTKTNSDGLGRDGIEWLTLVAQK